jgi:DNA-binding MurR/RpiR family transcriptional regulator
MGSAEIVERIKAAMDGMPGQMQTAARFIIDHLSEVALLSMREQARRIYCIGARATFPVAYLFDYTQRYYSDKISLLEGAGGSGIDLMHNIGRKDALLAVSPSPYANSTHRAAELAHAAGAPVVAITDSESAPVARIAKTAILVSAQSPSFFDTISPALAAAEIIVVMLASRVSPDVPKKVRQHERHLQAAGVFWSSAKRSQNGS